MKKKLLVMIVMLITVFLGIIKDDTVYAAVCSNCFSGSHETGCRSYVQDSARPAAGHWEKCCCGAKTFDSGVFSHTYGSWSNHSRTCSKCSYTQSHDGYFSVYERYDATDHKRVCEYCPAWYREAHNFTKSCSTCGQAVICGGCGYEKDHTCETHEHSYSTRIIQSATCTDSGLQETYCDCGDSTTTTIPALGHNYGDYLINGDAGHHKLCSVCNTYSNTEPHVYGELGTAINDSSYHSRKCQYCFYETDIEKHNMVVNNRYSSPNYRHSLICSICENYTRGEACTMTSKVTRQPSCTAAGNRRYTCSVCGQYYDEAIPKIEHQWSDWKTNQTEHWKICDYGCGTETSRGAHIDVNPQNGYCDTCNYLMYIPPVGNVNCSNGSISGYAVKEGETAGFYVSLTKGTQPISYQWYYKSSESATGTLISGATDSAYNFAATRDMNGRFYYCVISNPGGSYTTNSVQLTVYYKFTISPQPQPVTLKENETATFTVDIGEDGNPANYEFQWYVANSATGAGSKIANATTKTYSVKPTKNIHAQYYYCVVSNGQYDISSDKAKLVADITRPQITIGTFDNNAIINKTATLKIPFTVSDTGEGYTENNNNFTAEDIVIKVGGVQNSVSKSLKHISASENNHEYELTLTNINGNGKLSLEVLADSFQDNFGNKNVLTKFDTNVTIDNYLPAIALESVSGNINEKYMNENSKITVKISITEAVGINLNELTIEDIVINVGGTVADNLIQKTFKYVEKIGNKYIYEITLTNIKGNGLLSLKVPANSVKDFATNANVETELSLTVNNEIIIVDNKKPVINNLITTLGTYNNTSRNYPDSILTIHNGWANENIYVQIDAEDNTKIDYYMKAIGTNNTFTRLNSNQDIISNSINDAITYRVVDKAGNYTDISKNFKLDKEFPNKPIISLFEQRQNGANYTFNANKPTDKSIYVIPNASTVVDNGTVKSGIQTDMTYTYYTINSYTDISKKSTLMSPKTLPWNEGWLLEETGYYEIQMVSTDIAGNQVKGDVFKVYIDKKAENTIRISNINDIGSGINHVTINVFKSDNSGNKTSEKAIDEIVIENPYKEIIKNVRLGEGTFYVEVILEDKVCLNTVLTEKLTNNL